ncbi:MAG TPA: hypothetical protein VH107_01020 [Lacipirellulaceae bacterium]|nr:hypothetical protein [Lacipirellulaceae bacterium]
MTEPQATGLLGPRSLDALLAGLIDYAGLFPPAGLDLQTAVENYAKYLAGPYARALGRFVLPVSCFAEFEEAFSHLQPIEPWGISALVGSNYESDLTAIEKFNERHVQAAYVDVIEIKATTAQEISQIRACVRGTITPYFEIRPFDCSELLQTIHQIRGRAKIRTGGIKAEMFPPSDIVAGFLVECAKHKVPFKATAGLHHPIRCQKPLTYEHDAPAGMMHGFLNVFLMAAFCYGHESPRPPDLIVSLLNVVDPCLEFTDAFAFIRSPVLNQPTNRGLIGDPHGQGAHTRIPIARIQAARQNFAISFGSCSFEEPIADLKALNLL